MFSTTRFTQSMSIIRFSYSTHKNRPTENKSLPTGSALHLCDIVECRAVMAAYGFTKRSPAFSRESACVAELMKLYKGWCRSDAHANLTKLSNLTAMSNSKNIIFLLTATGIRVIIILIEIVSKHLLHLSFLKDNTYSADIALIKQSQLQISRVGTDRK